jgi:hypothetical protein
MSSHEALHKLKSLRLIKPLVEFRRRAISRSHEARRQSIERGIDARGQAAADAIYALLSSGEPCLVGRFGSCELGVVADDNAKRYRGDITQHVLVRKLAEDGGFYPVSADSVRAFSKLYISIMGSIDILGSWCPEELLFRKNLSGALRIPLADIEPYSAAQPWTRALRGRKVLVVNPMSATIAKQYNKRAFIFANQNVLPDFQLSLYRPVYEFREAQHAFASWFAALDTMKRAISQLDFDVAVLGCGPFGMPLAAFIKDEMHRQAVVMGGATQVWFGIKGTRWDYDPFFQSLYNDYWVYPSENETPDNSGTLENGCYWKNEHLNQKP